MTTDNAKIAALKQKAEGGDAVAQHNLGERLFKGEGVSKDYGKAMELFHLSAEQGNARAQTALGMIYGNKNNPSRNESEAAKWLRLAAEQGHANAQAQLGVIYYFGKGVPQNYRESYIWFSLAAANGVENCVKNRQTVEKNLTPANLNRAQDEALRRMKEIEVKQAAATNMVVVVGGREFMLKQQEQAMEGVSTLGKDHLHPLRLVGMPKVGPLSMANIVSAGGYFPLTATSGRAKGAKKQQRQEK